MNKIAIILLVLVTDIAYGYLEDLIFVLSFGGKNATIEEIKANKSSLQITCYKNSPEGDVFFVVKRWMKYNKKIDLEIVQIFHESGVDINRINAVSLSPDSSHSLALNGFYSYLRVLARWIKCLLFS